MISQDKKKVLEKAMRENYVAVRDEDWELLCLLAADPDWGYAAYTLEQYIMTKEDIEKILDRSSWVSLIKKLEFFESEEDN